MNGIELIAKERQEQLEKHDISVKNDVQFNSLAIYNGLPALPIAAIGVLDDRFGYFPSHWNGTMYDKMRNKTYKERLIIAGALIGAEIDRLQCVEDENKNNL